MKTIKLPPQLHVGMVNPKQAQYSVKNNSNKPKGYVVWTSTFNPKVGSAWIDWCAGEDFSHGLKSGGFKCTLKPSARVAVIDTRDDLREILAKYRRNVKNQPGKFLKDFYRRFIDYVELAKDFDGLHLTDEGQWRTRLPKDPKEPDLYGWDAESTVFFRDVFKSCEPISLSRYCKRRRTNE